MINDTHYDTITAIATPAGSGAIAIIRLSGKKSIEIADKIFTSKNKTKLTKTPANKVIFGKITDKNNNTIDEVLTTVFRAPNSYTGEDSIEIACHGSIYIQQKIIELLLNNGAKLASPGEFTQRAFFNGKLDLSQAEAVGDLIAATTETANRLAIQQMKGKYSETLNNLRNKLLNFVSLIELENDFAEEDVEFADRTQLNKIINEVNSLITNLIESFSYGNAIKNGIPVAITGKPNAGKSTLLNALINENRAIVSEIPGTTRDTIEEVLNINGFQFRFIDTAGLRKTNDKIEKIGVKKTYEKINKSNIFIYLFDINNTATTELQKDLNQFNTNIPKLIIANKIDLTNKKTINKFKEIDTEILFISAKQNKSIDKIKNKLLEFVKDKLQNPNDIIITNARHYEALLKAQQAITQTINSLQNNISSDLIALDIRNAIFYIGEITGEISNDDILGNIFKNFCIGK